MRTKSKVKGLLTALGVAACTVAIAVGGVLFSKLNNKTVASAASFNSATSGGVLSVNSSNEFILDGSGNTPFQNKLVGGQNSYVYFGHGADYVTPIRWAVLDKNNNNGVDNAILLFSDSIYKTATLPFNDSGSNSSSYFWYSSKLRSFLNGYPSYWNGNTEKQLLGGLIALETDRDSTIGIMQSKAILRTNLTTYGFHNNLDTHDWTLKGNAGVISNKPNGGSYMGSTLTLGTSNSTYYRTEITEDYVFLLDYKDIFNTEYGFTQHMSGASFDPYSGTTIPGLTKATISGKAANQESFYLRNGISSKHGGSYACYVDVANHYINSTSVDTKMSFRIACNLNPKAIIYATTQPVGNTFSSPTMPTDGSAPTYKIFTSCNGNETPLPSFIPKIYIKDGILNATIDRVDTRVCNLTLLITPKTATNGAVQYQVEAPLQQTENQTVTFNLPSEITGATLKDYNLTWLQSNQPDSADVYRSDVVFGLASGYTYVEPADYEITYDGEEQIFSAPTSGEKPEWYTRLSDAVDITYEDENGEEVTSIIDSGNYTAIYTLKDNDGKFTGTGESATVRRKKFTVKKKTVTLDKNPTVDETGAVKNGLPSIVGVIHLYDSGDANRNPTVKLQYQAYNTTSWVDDPPSGAGTHKVKAILWTGSMDDNDPSNDVCNYVLNTDYITEYTRTADKVTVPYFATSELTYNGEEQEFALLGFDSTAVNITNLSSFTYTGTGNDLVFKAKDWQDGDYTLNFALKTDDGVTRVWDSGTDGDNGVKNIKFKIKKKPLTITFTSAPTVNSFDWGYKQADGSIEVTHDGLENDTIALDINYYDTSTPNVKLPVTGTTFDKISELEIGSYALSVALKAAADDNANKNYEIEGTTATQAFSIGENEVTITPSQLSWQIINPEVSGGEAQALTANQHVTFNDKDYTVKLDESGLADLGVEVDGDYANGVKKNAETYTTTVTLKCLAGFKFSSSSQKTFTVNWTIDKADYNLSEVKWQYKNGSVTQEYTADTQLEYTGNEYEMSLGGLPVGLTASFTGHKHTDANTAANPTYTTKVNSWTCDANHNKPDLSAVADCVWKISPKVIEIGWKETAYTGSNGTFGYMVIDNDSYKNVVEYKYYSDSDCQNEVQIEDITVDPTNKVEYYVVMSLKDSTKDNYTLSGNNTSSFIVGESKKTVTLSLNAASCVYNGTAQGGLKYETDSTSFGENDLIVKYYLKTDTSFANPLTEKPVNAGKYVIVGSLSDAAKSGHIISGDDTFEFEILKADFDMSDVHWQYAAAGETPLVYTEALSYIAGEYTLTLAGLPDGLTVKVYDGYIGDVVGTYQASVVEWDYDKDNYNAPSAVAPKDWEIKKATIEVKFKDADNGSFTYKAFDNDTYANLVNVKYYKDSACTDEIALADIKVDAAAATTYYVQVTLKVGADVNYELSGTAKLSFKVGENKTPVTVSIKGSGLTYDGQSHFELSYDTMSTTLTKDDVIAEYYLKSDTSFENPLTEKPVNAGDYVVKIKLSDTAAANHAIVGEATFEYSIKKATLDMSGVKWGYIDENGNEVEYDPTKPLNYTVKDGQPVAQNVVLIGLPEYLKDKVTYGTPMSGVGTYDASYTIDKSLIDTINYELPDESLIPDLEEGWTIARRELEQPKLQKFWLRYDGTEKTFVLNGFDENYMVITDGSLKQTEVGKYTVKLGLVDETNTKWAGTNDANLEYKFEIIAQDASEPLDTDDPNIDNPGDDNTDQNKPGPVGPSVTDDNNNNGGFSLPDGFPLWQVIVGGVSIVLIAVFAAKIASCANAAKDYKRRAAKVSTKTMAAGAMINDMLFGISNTWWTVIALALAGVAVVLFIVLLAMSSAVKKAKIALEDAEEAYDEACRAEKEERERLEKQRHDEEMKMLMMMLNGGGKGGVTYAAGAVPTIDLDELAKRVAAALLPNMQQQTAQLTAGGEYDDSELRQRIEELEDKDDGFNDFVEFDLDDFEE